ncbi:MAG TPA: hypothetical protein VHM25_09880, partial [Polyangiaceae bacterium]|nr:hypothetical protein [Polyangiaceae bacterium]
VRMVQQARVPSIRQINPKVSVELERVIARALAGNPAARYQTARDFGRDLNDMLFHMGRAVSSFDIAQLVEPIRLERENKKKNVRYDRRSIIGSLIDEALFEFTSLEEGAAGGAKASGLLSAVPLQLGSFAGVPSWGEDLAGLSLDSPPAAPSGDSFDFGNLAALEDDPVTGRVRSEFPAASGSSRPPMPRSAPAATAAPGSAKMRPLPALTPPPQQKPPVAQPPQPARLAQPSSSDIQYPAPKSKAPLIAMIVVLIAVVGAAGAYFSGAMH